MKIGRKVCQPIEIILSNEILPYKGELQVQLRISSFVRFTIKWEKLGITGHWIIASILLPSVSYMLAAAWKFPLGGAPSYKNASYYKKAKWNSSDHVITTYTRGL